MAADREPVYPTGYTRLAVRPEVARQVRYLAKRYGLSITNFIREAAEAFETKTTPKEPWSPWKGVTEPWRAPVPQAIPLRVPKPSRKRETKPEPETPVETSPPAEPIVAIAPANDPSPFPEASLLLMAGFRTLAHRYGLRDAKFDPATPYVLAQVFAAAGRVETTVSTLHVFMTWCENFLAMGGRDPMRMLETIEEYAIVDFDPDAIEWTEESIRAEIEG